MFFSPHVCVFLIVIKKIKENWNLKKMHYIISLEQLNITQTKERV